MTYRLIDGEIHRRNSDGHYMPLTVAEAEHVVRTMNVLIAAGKAAGAHSVPEHMLTNAVDLLDRFDDSDTEPLKDSQ